MTGGGGGHLNQRPNQGYSSVHSEPQKRFHGEGGAAAGAGKAETTGGAMQSIPRSTLI